MSTLDTSLEAILGRPVYDMRIEAPLERLVDKRILVTGAAGSIGRPLVDLLLDNGCDVQATDLEDRGLGELDVVDGAAVFSWMRAYAPEVVFNMAGAKHAPAGEEDPWHAVQVNTVGTKNLLDYAGGARVLTASTCKACNPETAYGASKLIAERLTLNAGQTVARFYNVVETQGNVFDIWSQIPESDPIPYTNCERYFISLAEALGLLLWSAVLPPARYTIDPGFRRWMPAVALIANPHRDVVEIPARRGDRSEEPLSGTHEEISEVEIAMWGDGTPLRRVISPHD